MPLTGYTDCTVTFVDASTPEDQITYWLWDFGDGSAYYEGQTPPAHLYDTPGVYTVTLHVASAKGIDTFSDTVTITLPPFVLTLTGSGYANATLFLVPVGDWNPNDPLDRAAGSNTRTALGGVVQLDSSDPDWGGTFDLLIWGDTYQYGALEQGIVIELASLTVDLEWPNLNPIAVNGINKTVGQTFTMSEAFATNPPAKAGIKGRIYDAAGPTLLLEDTWDGNAWGGSASDPLLAGTITVDCFWFDEAWGEFATTFIETI